MILNFDEFILNESVMSTIGFSIFPNSEKEITNPEISLLLKTIIQYYDHNNIEWDSPLALNPKTPNEVKIIRHLKTQNFINFMNLKGYDLSEPRNKYGKLRISYGEGSRGGRGAKSKGLLFEDLLGNDLRTYVNKGYVKRLFNYPDIVQKLIKLIDLDNANEIIVKPTGYDNTQRALVFKPYPEIEKMTSGAKIADIVLIVDNKEYYLSLKSGKTLALFNIGIKKYIKTNDIINNSISSDGLKLLEIFDIKPEIFSRVFNEYGNVNFKEFHHFAKPNKKIETFLHTAFGNDYYVIHEMGGGKHDIYYMDNKYAKESSMIVGDIKIEYGGARGLAKQVNIKLKTNNFMFNIKIRNPFGDIYPTHIFGEYKKI